MFVFDVFQLHIQSGSSNRMPMNNSCSSMQTHQLNVESSAFVVWIACAAILYSCIAGQHFCRLFGVILGYNIRQCMHQHRLFLKKKAKQNETAREINKIRNHTIHAGCRGKGSQTVHQGEGGQRDCLDQSAEVKKRLMCANFVIAFAVAVRLCHNTAATATAVTGNSTVRQKANSIRTHFVRLRCIEMSERGGGQKMTEKWSQKYSKINTMQRNL